ncbi:unnamed protein product [Ilex paraguariensis]|uniref:CTCHY-type domain-containing protein n=1 Tax=Ilex paraguariensis TaxID=185542 RepID=A0ABC8RTT5_9AQUA
MWYTSFGVSYSCEVCKVSVAFGRRDCGYCRTFWNQQNISRKVYRFVGDNIHYGCFAFACSHVIGGGSTC